VIFTPHLVPMDRGILATIYARPTRTLTQADVLAALRAAYEGEPFVRVVDHLPATKHVSGTNLFHVTARIVRDRVVVLAVLDNLLKGASGVALQNFNLMCGFEETAGF
jgi:N-acetyl-gamma-glutamyl-phosphate reductase